jgi:hypothetical protein
MKNVMMSLMFLILVTTGIYAKEISPIDNGNPSADQVNADNLSLGSDTLSVNGPVSIADNRNAELELKLYPNPATTNLTVSFDCNSNGLPEPVIMYIIDMRGRIVVSVNDMAYPGGTYHKDIDVRGLPDEDYVFQLIRGNRKLVKKFQVYY